jgi:hypothetical protein
MEIELAALDTTIVEADLLRELLMGSPIVELFWSFIALD